MALDPRAFADNIHEAVMPVIYDLLQEYSHAGVEEFVLACGEAESTVRDGRGMRRFPALSSAVVHHLAEVIFTDEVLRELRPGEFHARNFSDWRVRVERASSGTGWSLSFRPVTDADRAASSS